VVVHHRSDDRLHLINAVEGRLILAPDPAEPTAGKDTTIPVRYPSSSIGDIAPFGAAGHVKKPSHVDRESAIMPLLYNAPSPRPNSTAKPVDGVIVERARHRRTDGGYHSIGSTVDMFIAVAEKCKRACAPSKTARGSLSRVA